MLYKILFITLFTLIFSHADNFKRINPDPTESMLQKQKDAHPCPSPIEANEELTEDFKYGCFCGKEYPKLESNSTNDFRKLSKKERLIQIEHLYSIEPYDDIDAICQQHDICFLYKGKKAKVCNDGIYDELYAIAKKFEEQNQTKENEQCKNLAVDMASAFKTLFTLADDEDTIFDFGAAMFNTGITVATKTVQESVDTLSDDGDRYPKDGYRCTIQKEERR